MNTLPGDKIFIDRVNTLSNHEILVDSVNTLPVDKILVDRVNTLSNHKILVDSVNTLSNDKIFIDRVNTLSNDKILVDRVNTLPGGLSQHHHPAGHGNWARARILTRACQFRTPVARLASFTDTKIPCA